MSISHYKAEKLEQSGTSAVYRFWSDYVSDETVYGVFQVDTESWSFTIIESLPGVSPTAQDVRCVLALIHKMKKHHLVANSLPETVYFVA
ncbi:MAG TPA: hypothetical protein PL157_01125 [Acidobacteriota bacterium]|nr:hypothetical protein [Acidobacteriota bacterium]